MSKLFSNNSGLYLILIPKHNFWGWSALVGIVLRTRGTGVMGDRLVVSGQDGFF
ncbi:MAG: hypothetical protein MGF17_12610 [Trichodesmium sp. MAG_R04]|nr:hypothetical protein [Trichodesmium sp. MAG_R04]